MALKLYGVLLCALLSIKFVKASEKNPKKLVRAVEFSQLTDCLSNFFDFLRNTVQPNYIHQANKISDPKAKEQFLANLDNQVREIFEFPINTKRNALLKEYTRLLNLRNEIMKNPQKYQEKVKNCLSKYNDPEWQKNFKAEFDAQRAQRDSWCVIL